MNRIPLATLPTRRPSPLTRLLRHKLLLLIVAGFAVWTQAPEGSVEGLADYFVQEFDLALGTGATDLEDAELAELWRPAPTSDSDEDSFESLAPVIDLVCGDVCELRGGRLHFDRADRYAQRLAEVNEG